MADVAKDHEVMGHGGEFIPLSCLMYYEAPRIAMEGTLALSVGSRTEMTKFISGSWFQMWSHLPAAL